MTPSATQLERTQRFRAEAALVLVTLLWGMSFPWMKEWQAAAGGCPGGTLLSGLTLIAERMALAVVLLAAFRPRLFGAATPRAYAAGAAVGAAFFAGFALQVWGIASTTPSLSAFFTSLCCAWAPLFGWVFLRQRVATLTLLGLLVGLGGTFFFVESDWLLGFGETLTLLASLFFAVQILILDRQGRNVSPAHLTPSFFLTTGLLSAAAAVGVAAATCGVTAWWRWLVGINTSPTPLRNLALMAALPTFLAFHLMNTYQPRLPASRAALIYLLEPVFSSVLSVGLGYEKLTTQLLLGGGFILAGNVLVEAANWLLPPEKQAAEAGGTAADAAQSLLDN